MVECLSVTFQFVAQVLSIDWYQDMTLLCPFSMLRHLLERKVAAEDVVNQLDFQQIWLNMDMSTYGL